MSARLSTLRLSSLFFLSATLIAYELAVMRTFAVGSWSNFGSMVISIALLGYGLAGTILTFLEARVAAKADRWLFGAAVLLAPAMVLAHSIAQLVPFNPVMIPTDRRQYLWIAAYYGLYAIPFFMGAGFVGVAFVAFRSRIHQLYFWNMVGSGLGGFLVLGLLWLLPPDRLMGPIVAIASASAFLACVGRKGEGGGLSVPWPRLAAWLVLLVLSFAALGRFGAIKVSEFKPISYARDFPDAQRVYHAYGPTGELDAYRSSYFHVAPGLSDNASSALATMPTDAFLGLFVDGDGPIGVMRALAPTEVDYLDFLPMAAPYTLLKEPRVLVLRLGGGIGAYGALHHGAKKVTVVEPDPGIVRMLRDEPFFKEYTGGLLADPRVNLVNTEPRAFAAGARDAYDLVEIGLVDSVGLSQTGGYAVAENFLYTAEGIASYLSALGDDGILSITVWNKLTMPRNVPKLLATVVEALGAVGATRADGNVFVFDQLLSTATVLAKKRPFTAAEIERLRGFCRRMSFNACYYPGMPAPAMGFDEVMKGYRSQLLGPAAGGAGEGGGSAELRQEDLYYHTLAALFRGEGKALYDSYAFSIAPATDDRPYYTAYVKPRTLPAVFQNIRDLSEEWGYVLLVATLGLSVAFGFLIVLVPLVGRRKELFAKRKGTIRVIAYFSCLGIGYMLIEMFLIQRLTFFLVDPIFSNAVVITAMLVLSGVGSLWSGGGRLSKRTVLTLAVAGICASCLFYIFGLPAIVSGALGLPLAAKIGLAVLFIAPAAFCLGIPFPTGLSSLSSSRPGLVPWAWGVNGALSVTGTVLARLVSISAGYAAVLASAMALYLLALAVSSGNEAGVSRMGPEATATAPGAGAAGAAEAART